MARPTEPRWAMAAGPLRSLVPRGTPMTPAAPSTACLRKPNLTRRVTPRQLHIYSEIAVEVRLRPVEVEITDRNAAQVPAQPRINRLAHDPVHTRKRADVDDPCRALPRQVDRLPDVQHH